MTTLILVRHAESAPSPELDEAAFPLSERGREQAQALAPLLAELGVDALASSPFQRALDTLAPFAEARALDIAVDDDLRERRLGSWLEDAEAVREAIRRMQADADFRREGGETGRDCLARYEAALARVVDANPGRTIAVGAHGGVIGHFLAARTTDLPAEFWRRIRNPHLFVFEVDGAWRWVGERTLDGPTLRDWPAQA
jgi:2,3-bisphosphoglycerate-dependent phosphoglycerate mutase